MRLDNMKFNRPRAPHSLLSEEQAQQILDAATKEEATALAKKFGVKEQVAYKIRRRVSWRHLTPKVIES